MKILWKVIWKEIRQKPGRFAALVTGMTAAVFLITVVTAFSNSCLQSMIRQEKEENGPYEAVFHNLTRGQARRLAVCIRIVSARRARSRHRRPGPA